MGDAVTPMPTMSHATSDLRGHVYALARGISHEAAAAESFAKLLPDRSAVRQKTRKGLQEEIVELLSHRTADLRRSVGVWADLLREVASPLESIRREWERLEPTISDLLAATVGGPSPYEAPAIPGSPQRALAEIAETFEAFADMALQEPTGRTLREQRIEALYRAIAEMSKGNERDSGRWKDAWRELRTLQHEEARELSAQYERTLGSSLRRGDDLIRRMDALLASYEGVAAGDPAPDDATDASS